MSHPSKIIGNQHLIWGTVMLGAVYGQIEDASEDLMADLNNIRDGLNNTQAVVYSDERFELTLTVMLDSTATLPELGDDITFPEAGVTGQITSRGRRWSAGGVLKMEVKATHWKAMGSEPATGTVPTGD